MVEIVVICLNSCGGDRDLFGLCAFPRQEGLVSAWNVFGVAAGQEEEEIALSVLLTLGSKPAPSFHALIGHCAQRCWLHVPSNTAVEKGQGNVRSSLLFLFVITGVIFFCASPIPVLCMIIIVILLLRRNWLRMHLFFLPIKGASLGSIVWTFNTVINAPNPQRCVCYNFCPRQCGRSDRLVFSNFILTRIQGILEGGYQLLLNKSLWKHQP